MTTRNAVGGTIEIALGTTMGNSVESSVEGVRPERAAGSQGTTWAGRGLGGALRLELAKARRLRILPVTVLLGGVAVAMSSTHLFSESFRAGAADPASHPWQGLLISCVMANCMIGPVLVAVLASRQTAMEHDAAGWTLAATAGMSPGSVCRAKLMVLTGMLLVVTTVQTLVLVVAARLAGVTAALDARYWILYTALLVVVNTAMCALHVLLAALVDTQMVCVGVGLLGAFVAAFSILMPPALARLLPWGYYAVISSAQQTGSQARDVVYTVPDLPWVAGFTIVTALIFWATTRWMDRTERTAR